MISPVVVSTANLVPITTSTTATGTTPSTTVTIADLNGTWSEHDLSVASAPSWMGWNRGIHVISNGANTTRASLIAMGTLVLEAAEPGIFQSIQTE